MIILKYILTFLLLIISVTVNTYFGSIGVFPIDTFAFFDSANMLNQGFVPFKDYWVMSGFMIDIIQSTFFKYFGVSWQVYQLHSSLVNFFFFNNHILFLFEYWFKYFFKLFLLIVSVNNILFVSWGTISRPALCFFFINWFLLSLSSY